MDELLVISANLFKSILPDKIFIAVKNKFLIAFCSKPAFFFHFIFKLSVNFFQLLCKDEILIIHRKQSMLLFLGTLYNVQFF